MTTGQHHQMTIETELTDLINPQLCAIIFTV